MKVERARTERHLIELLEILAKPLPQGGLGFGDTAESPIVKLLEKVRSERDLAPAEDQ